MALANVRWSSTVGKSPAAAQAQALARRGLAQVVRVLDARRLEVVVLDHLRKRFARGIRDGFVERDDCVGDEDSPVHPRVPCACRGTRVVSSGMSAEL